MINRSLILFVCWSWVMLTPLAAHDLWIETNVAVVAPNESIEVAFKLGNCAQGKRTFRTSGLVDKAGVSSSEIHPSGKRQLIANELVRSGEDAGGYWHMTRELKEVGPTWFCQSLDQTIEHDGQTMRGLVSGKAFVVTRNNDLELAKVKVDVALGFPLELVLCSTPFPSISQSKTVRVQLLLNGKPLAQETVSFLPHAIDTKKQSVEDFERRTDGQGMAEYAVAKPGLYLISARHLQSSEAQSDPVYFSTTLTLRVTRNALQDLHDKKE